MGVHYNQLVRFVVQFRLNELLLSYIRTKYMTKIWKYRYDNSSCGSRDTARYTSVRIWRGFWLFCHDDLRPCPHWPARFYRNASRGTRKTEPQRSEFTRTSMQSFKKMLKRAWSEFQCQDQYSPTQIPSYPSPIDRDSRIKTKDHFTHLSLIWIRLSEK